MAGPSDSGQNPQAPFVPLPTQINFFPGQMPGMMSPEDFAKAQEAQRKVADSQSRSREEDGRLKAGADPDYVRTADRFGDKSLEDLIAAVHGDGAGKGGLDSAGLQGMRKTWFEACSDLENLSTFNLLGMNNIFNHGLWQGASGSAAQAASERFARAANEIGQVFGSVSQRMDALAWAADAVKLAVPKTVPQAVVTPNPDNPIESLLPGVVNPDYQHAQETARKNARDAAIHALESLYTPSFPPAGAGVPAYIPVPQIGGGADDRAAGGGGGANGTGTGGRGSGSGNESGKPSTGDPHAPGSDQNNPAQTNPAAAGGSGSPAAQTKPSTLGPTGLPGDTAGTSTTPAGLGAGSTGGLPGSGSGGFGGIGGLGGGSRPGSPGASRPGSPTGAPGVDSRAAAAARGAAGTMGPMAPGAAGKRKEGEEDREHRIPDYLRGVQPEWLEGLRGHDGVIGGDLVRNEDDSAR